MLSLKRNKLEELIFKTLIFLAPTQIAFHWWPDFSHIFGIRVDYLAPSLYLTDILVLFLIILSQKIISLNKKTLLLALFIFANIFLAINPAVALIKWVKVFEFALLAIIISKNTNFNLEEWVLKPLSISLIFFSLIGFAQIVLGKTIGGIFYWFGERSFNLSTPGIALFQINGVDFLRPYSTFSHPNSMAGYFLVSACLILLFKKNDLLKKASIVLSGFSIFLSFSLGAILSLYLSPIYKFFFEKRVSIVILFAAVSILASIFSGSLLDARDFPLSAKERLVLIESAGKVFSMSPITGVGFNNFFIAGKSLQPVHNIFLLVLTETGIVGLALFLILLIYLVKNPKTGIPVLLIITTGLFDHYWLTLEQNELLLSIVFGLSLRKWKK